MDAQLWPFRFWFVSMPPVLVLLKWFVSALTHRPVYAFGSIESVKRKVKTLSSLERQAGLGTRGQTGIYWRYVSQGLYRNPSVLKFVLWSSTMLAPVGGGRLAAITAIKSAQENRRSVSHLGYPRRGACNVATRNSVTSMLINAETCSVRCATQLREMWAGLSRPSRVRANQKYLEP